MAFDGLDPIFVFLLGTLLILIFGTYFFLRKLLTSAREGYSESVKQNDEE